MSQWTHFIGVIRYESMLANVWPEPANKARSLMNQVEYVHRCFQTAKVSTPFGSEGPLQFDTILTDRGPTVVITGDLRDFGNDDLCSVINWLNSIDPTKYDEYKILMVRDAAIYCDVEGYHDGKVFIFYNHGDHKFELKEMYDDKQE